jgi:hypothetical protein
MRTAFIRRGPWGYIQERHPDLPGAADWRLATLAELPPIVAGANAVSRGADSDPREALTVLLLSSPGLGPTGPDNPRSRIDGTRARISE